MARRILSHIGLMLAAVIVLFPILWVLRTSLVPEPDSYGTTILPSLTLDNYRTLFAQKHFGRNYLNSLIVASMSVIVTMPLAAMTGYAFARFGSGGRAARFVTLASQMLPPVALALPTFMLFRGLGLTNSLVGLTIVHAAINLPFLTWILMGFFEAIPHDLEGAAMTDGATRLEAFWRVVVPVATPGILAAGVLGFILSWNEFLFALILGGANTATVPVALASLQTSNGVQISNVAAGVWLAILPLMIASRFIQKYLVEGLSFGSVK